MTKITKVDNWFNTCIPNLKKLRGYGSFHALDNEVTKGLPMHTFSSRFPVQPPWRVAHPALAGVMPHESIHHPNADLTFNDRELLMRFYKAAIAHQIKENSIRREELERKMEAMSDDLAVVREHKMQMQRIEVSIEERFRMERLFAQLKIEEQDNLKRIVARFMDRRDGNHRYMLDVYLKQAGFGAVAAALQVFKKVG